MWTIPSPASLAEEFKPTLVHDWGHCMNNHSVLVTLVTNVLATLAQLP